MHIIDVDQVEAIEPAIRSSEPGRYHVDEISADPMPSGHTSRRWGVGIKRSIDLEGFNVGPVHAMRSRNEI